MQVADEDDCGSDDEDWLRTIHKMTASSSSGASSSTAGLTEDDRPMSFLTSGGPVLCTDACYVGISSCGEDASASDEADNRAEAREVEEKERRIGIRAEPSQRAGGQVPCRRVQRKR